MDQLENTYEISANLDLREWSAPLPAIHKHDASDSLMGKCSSSAHGIGDDSSVHRMI